MQKLPSRSLSPALMTGLDGEPSPDTPRTHLRRGAAHRSRRPGKEERRQLMPLAISFSSHLRTVPGPASLGSDSTATSVSMADGSNAEERHNRFRWTTTMVLDWFTFNLSCRTQSVFVAFESTLSVLKCGVLQGFVLGSLLFCFLCEHTH